MTQSQPTASTLEEIFPLTPVQNFILDISRATPSGLAFQQQYTYYLSGEVEPELVRKSWEVVVARHPSLRTSFHWKDLSQSFQVVHSKASLPFFHRDLRGLSEEERNATVFAWLKEDFKKPFDLLVPPLMRLALMQLEDRLFIMTLTLSHLVFDGWSLGASFGLFARTYAAISREEAPDTTPFPSMRDYAVWYRNRDSSADTAWWLKNLRNAVAPRLPFMKEASGAPANAPVEADRIHHLFFTREETVELEQAAKSMGVTLNVLYQGTWALILSRLSPERRAVMFTVAASRPSNIRNIDEIFGVLIDGIPYNLHCDGNSKVNKWLQEIQLLQIENMEHQYAPIQKWIGAGNEDGHVPFNSYLIFENHATGEGDNDSGKFAIHAAYMNSNLSFPISMMVFPGNSLRVAIIYSSSCFDDEKIPLFAECLRTALKTMAAHPQHTLDEVSALALLDEEHLS